MATYNNTSAFGCRRYLDAKSTSLPKLLCVWINRARQRYQLRDMDDRLLRDMGISRGDAVRESMKPFWQE